MTQTAELERLRLNATIHGESGVGKSWLLASMPAPRLILDAEGGSRFAPSVPAEWKPGARIEPRRKIVWNPDREDPPAAGKWDTCLVFCRSLETMDRVYQWLYSGKHPFISCGLDQLTEIQSRIIDNIAGRDQMTERNWGELLRNMEDLVRKYRDLVLHPTKPLDAVMFAAGSKMQDGKVRPLLQGQMRDKLPYFTDVVGYMHTKMKEERGIVRRLLIQPIEEFVAKDRTHLLTQHYGPVIENPNATEMLAVLNSQPTESKKKEEPEA